MPRQFLFGAADGLEQPALQHSDVTDQVRRVLVAVDVDAARDD